VLLVVPSYKDFLDLPGGYVEPAETPRATVQRELREERPIEPAVGRLLVADWWHEDTNGQDDAKLLLVSDGGRLAPAQLDDIAVGLPAGARRAAPGGLGGEPQEDPASVA
jgi:8-oxo-dGTP diphosphatase